jgi:hypothetical protein
MFLRRVDTAYPLPKDFQRASRTGVSNVVEQRRKTARIEIEFWFDDDGSIRLASEAGPDFHVRVRAEPLKRNGHPSLYCRLAWILKDADAATPKE